MPGISYNGIGSYPLCSREIARDFTYDDNGLIREIQKFQRLRHKYKDDYYWNNELDNCEDGKPSRQEREKNVQEYTRSLIEKQKGLYRVYGQRGL